MGREAQKKRVGEGMIDITLYYGLHCTCADIIGINAYD